MDIKALIPKHKDDQEVIESLKGLSFEQLRPIVPELLKCLRDLHWPIAGPVADILAPYVDRITVELIEILKTNDGQWKWGIVSTLARHSTDPVLLKEIERIAQFPTRDEVEEEVIVEAIAILNGDYK